MSFRPCFCTIVALPWPAPPPCRGADHGRVGAQGDDEFGDPVHHCGRHDTYASSVVQSVELLLEPEAERGMFRVWEALLEAGLPSQARNTAPSNRPHVTLVAVPRLTADAESAVAAAASRRRDVGRRDVLRSRSMGAGPATRSGRRYASPPGGRCGGL